jgi:hypothetical protein
MMKPTQSEHPHTDLKHAHGHDRGRQSVPYWKRAHRDWKVWIAVLAMLGAMAIYIRSNDLSLRPHQVNQQPVP